jgi:hypothetical protein
VLSEKKLEIFKPWIVVIQQKFNLIFLEDKATLKGKVNAADVS